MPSGRRQRVRVLAADLRFFAFPWPDRTPGSRRPCERRCSFVLLSLAAQSGHDNRDCVQPLHVDTRTIRRIGAVAGGTRPSAGARRAWRLREVRRAAHADFADGGAGRADNRAGARSARARDFGHRKKIRQQPDHHGNACAHRRRAPVPRQHHRRRSALERRPRPHHSR